EHGPVFRVALFDLGPARPGRLLFVAHQLAVDGTSWRILLEDLETLGSAIARGEPPWLPPATTSYRQWVHGLEQEGKGTAPPGDPPPVGPLPLDVDGDRDPGTVRESDTVSVPLDADESRTLLEEVPQADGTELSDALLTALTEALARWTGQEA